MVKCKQCIHWIPITKDYVDPRKGWGSCDRGNSFGGKQLDPGSLMFGVDYETYRAHVKTNREFGCVMGEESNDDNI